MWAHRKRFSSHLHSVSVDEVFFLIVLVMTVVMVLWRGNERLAATFACDRGDFFVTFVDEVFSTVFFSLDCL